MASAALQSFRRRVTVDWPQQAHEDARKKLVAVAMAGHNKIMAEQKARSGAIPEFEAYANTPGNGNLNSVVLPGPIVYRYRYLREVVQFALDELRKASPVVSGDYVRSHTLFINGSAVSQMPVRLNPGDTIMIANPVPYARRLEIGKTESGRDFVLQVPNRIYERVAKNKLTPRYRNVAKITFQYVELASAYTAKGSLARHYGIGGGRKRKRRQQAGTKVQAPAIVIGVLS
jgi:hypothetical protein